MFACSSSMEIIVHTDHNIEGGARLSEYVTHRVEQVLGHLRTHLTRVVVHVSDENGPKHGVQDVRCVIEGRLEHEQPTAVHCNAADLHGALAGALDKLKRSLESTIAKRRVRGPGVSAIAAT
ncbi:MAG: HPF/RaiA family ribosome-associated protein [Kofleriaceae bacterium]